MDLSDALIGVKHHGMEVYSLSKPRPLRLYVMRAGKIIVVERDKYLMEREQKEQAEKQQGKPPYVP